MNKLKTKIPPPIITLCFGLMMWAMSLYFPIYLLNNPLLFWIAIAFILVGASLDVISFINFVRHKTTVNPIRPEKASNLVVTGFYRYSRNPMYLGMAFILLGSALLFANLGAFLVFPLFILAMNYLQIKPEEKVLETIFADHYLDYQKSVRRWI